MPRGGAWGERVSEQARARGLRPVVVPLITASGPDDPEPLRAAMRRLVGGEYGWLVATSATAVRVIGGLAPGLRTGTGGTRIAAVGEATAAAARAEGWTVDVVPETASAEALVDLVPATTARVLHPHADIAAPTLADGLRARGIDVDAVVAYRTVGTGTDPVRLDEPLDAVLVTSGSVARQVAARLPHDGRTRIACIGPRTAAEARAAGLPVHVIGRSRSAEALLDAVVADLERAELAPDPHHPPAERQP